MLAATDPDRAAGFIPDAERIAQSITDKNRKVGVLAGIAVALAATDPDNSARLIADAERIAQSIFFEDEEASALAEIAATLAATDPGRAERIAQSITDNWYKAIALGAIAEATSVQP